MIAVRCCLFLEEYEINGRKIRESTVANLQFLPTTPHISSANLAGQSQISSLTRLLDLIKSPQVISLHRPISSRGAGNYCLLSSDQTFLPFRRPYLATILSSDSNLLVRAASCRRSESSVIVRGLSEIGEKRAASTKSSDHTAGTFSGQEKREKQKKQEGLQLL
ncbi:hypothetical protein AOLI_G00282150 [Acnodon oligacanthus]